MLSEARNVCEPIKPMLSVTAGKRPEMVIFMSGGGSNAERLLERVRDCPDPPFHVAALVTDAPETSRTRELGARFDIRVIEHDIRAFYHRHGETRVSIATPRGQELRGLWTNELRALLAETSVDFAVFAGFVPLTNITGDFPCLNVHPGDLTYRRRGKRYLVGLHTVPIERAILEGLDHLRTSVIQAMPYTGRGDDMDNGPILGISEPVPIDLGELTLDECRRQFEARPERRPKGGYGDALEDLARMHQERLKVHGDWTVLPPVVFDFAEGRFGLDAEDRLQYRLGRHWHPVRTVVYDKDGGREILFRETVTPA